jgi:hypothetical protein
MISSPQKNEGDFSQMTRCLRLLVCLPLCTVLALAQTETVQPASSSSPVAFLYLAEPIAINGFAVSSAGKLTPLPGLPLAAPKLTRLSVTSKFLFGESGDGSVLNGYSISSKGSLTEVSSINPFNFEPGDNFGCFGIPDLQVDFAGSTVYSQENPGCANAGYASYVSFHIDSKGDL